MPSLLTAFLAVLVTFGLGFAWRHLGWWMWVAWDDLIIDPYKNWQILKPRRENVACFVTFSLGPFLTALAVAARTRRAIGMDHRRGHG